MDDDNRIKLRVMGMSYSPLQNGAFALLLAVEGDSPIRIPVVIGAAEAQSIALSLEKVNTPRPMTHDLFCSFEQAFGIRLTDVFIYRYEDGVFLSEMTFTDGERTITLDARTSDAVAVAMRSGAPIYTTPEIVNETGIELEEVENHTDNNAHRTVRAHKRESLYDLSIDELQKRLDSLIANENYEEAARISEIINNKKNQ